MDPDRNAPSRSQNVAASKRRSSRLLLAVGLAVVWLLQDTSHACAAHLPGAEGRGGAVVSGEADATAAGLEILEAGGNAVDAAVATALALAVVHPDAGNLGGGGFAVVRVGGELATLDFRETAPAAAHRDLFVDDEGVPIPEASTLGALAVGVPGTPDGLFTLHQRFGRRPWAAVAAPAIRLARDGFELSPRLHRTLGRAAEKLARFDESRSFWLPDGSPIDAGTRLRMPRLAAALEAYAELGPKALTEGPLARALVARVERHGGLLDEADLAAYEPVWRQPLRFRAFGWELAGMGLPSSGGIVSAITLGLLERLDWPEAPRFGAERAHLLAESWRLAYADRFLLGDPAEVRLDPRELLAAERLETEVDTLSPETAEVLEARGHRIALTALNDRSKINGVHRFPDGFLTTGADPRGPAHGGVVRGDPAASSQRPPG